MDDKKNTICPECQNVVEIPKDTRTGDVIECPFCGSELRIIAFDADGRAIIKVIEEEK